MTQEDSRALAGAEGINLAVVSFPGADGGKVHQVDSHVEVLDRLDVLIKCVSELKEEVRALKDGVSHLQHIVRDQLRGRSGEDVGARRQSSEDLESEGGPVKEPVDELTALLEKADRLHSCNGREKAQGLDLLIEKKEEYNEKCQYLWRLSRAYADAHDFAADLAEKKSCVANGNHIF
ncbi:regulator of microtubule dynamics protein 2-like [Triplophysa rosa]|uniref:Regulator of microtubule dynamics protein 2-like n=1 Tax=Triplophysa rosa TaxID=992332 RepID=A0A9W7WNE5_TRIRA|nr:regulator of microtubule dynamics protein 2-like [Triplophysa rosa]KAI7805403.1 putative regulator of microtubule dynamics protein 2-like [Triplophysa rosa]